MKQLEFEFTEICEIFEIVTHTKKMESSLKSVLLEGRLTVTSYPFQLGKENWKNSTKNISVSLHEVKWEEEKNHKFHTIKNMYLQLENWMHKWKWVSQL